MTKEKTRLHFFNGLCWISLSIVLMLAAAKGLSLIPGIEKVKIPSLLILFVAITVQLATSCAENRENLRIKILEKVAWYIGLIGATLRFAVYFTVL